MDSTYFWDLIEKSKDEHLNQIEWLQDQLSHMEDKDILDFEYILTSYFDQAFCGSL